MKEYWEITQERGTQTLAVWYLDPAFEITGTTLAEHTTRVAELETLALARAAAEGNLSDAREARDDHFALLAEMNVRVPSLIDGALTDDDDLHGQLDLVYSVTPGVGQATILRRARLVKGLWTDYNEKLAAQTPAKPALTMEYKKAGSVGGPVGVVLADFTAAMTAALAAQQADKDLLRAVSDTKSALRSAERRVDRDNKRWYKSWIQAFLEGTVKGDAARTQITTEQGTPPPNALPIQSLTPNANRTVLVTYSTTGGEHATTLELLWQLQGEEDFGHTTPLTRPNQTVGPFPASTTVTFVTRVANSTTGNVLSTPIAAAIPA